MNAFYPVRALTLALAPAALIALMSGCGGEQKVYQKKAAATGKAAVIPAPPQLPQRAKRDGDNYTVWGLVHDMHSKVHMAEVKKKTVTVVGYINKTNLIECKDDKKAVEDHCTPKCAVPDEKQKKDDAKEDGGFTTPPDCRSPPPTFWIAEKADEQKEMIAVMGWAGNFAHIKWAIDAYDDAKDLDEQKTVEYSDGMRSLPNPLPALGAKVEITTVYQRTYKGFGKPESEPKYGILGPAGEENKIIIKILQDAPAQATLPHMKERKKLKAGDPKDKDKDKDKDKKPK